MKVPDFSIIIPTFNRALFLNTAIDSVLNQTHTDFELIIIDDGSLDNTRSLVESCHDTRLNYIITEHKGVSSARNTGIKNAKSDWLCFLGSDDKFRKDKLAITYDAIQNNPDYKIFHTEEIWYMNGKLLDQKKIHKKPSGHVFPNALKICCIGMSTSTIHRSAFDEAGLFDESMQACEDYDLWLRMTLTMPVFLIKEALTIKQGGHKDQLSRTYPAMDRFRIYSLDKLLSSGKLDKSQYNLAYQELEHRCNIVSKGAVKRGNLDEIEEYKQMLGKYRN